MTSTASHAPGWPCLPCLRDRGAVNDIRHSDRPSLASRDPSGVQTRVSHTAPLTMPIRLRSDGGPSPAQPHPQPAPDPRARPAQEPGGRSRWDSVTARATTQRPSGTQTGTRLRAMLPRVQARGRGASGTAQSPAPRNPQCRDVSPRHRWFETSPTSGGRTEAAGGGRPRERLREEQAGPRDGRRGGRGHIRGAWRLFWEAPCPGSGGEAEVWLQRRPLRAGVRGGAGAKRSAGKCPRRTGSGERWPPPPRPAPPARQLLPAASAGRASGRCELSGPWQQLQLEATAGLCQLPAGARDHTLRDVCWGPKKALPGDKGGEDAGTWTRAQGGWQDAGSGPEAEAPSAPPL